MEIIVAESAGFCFGVDRAVKYVYDNIKKTPLYTYGPIIHNHHVVNDIKDKGVKVINTIEEFDHVPKGNVIIRSHGVSKEVYDSITEKDFSIIDATCPYVKKIHQIVNDYSKKGDTIVIVGDSNHPEVIGIKGWSNLDTTIIQNIEEAKNFNISNKKNICVVAQTTFNYIKFQEIIEILRSKGYDVVIKETICSATQKRQKEAIKLSSEVDTMIVIGGRHSSNTQKLYQLCKNQCDNTYHVETIEDLELLVLRSDEKIGITAGASTPKNIIQEVITHVRSTERN